MSTPQRFRKKLVEIEAAQWFKNGDHPEDNLPPNDKIVNGERTEGAVVRYFRNPDLPGARECKHCGRIMHDHGWIDDPTGGHTVCPGDWIVTDRSGRYFPVAPSVFAALFAPVDGEADVVIPEHTRQLLIDLGWTPPTSETVEPAATPERTTA